MYRHISVRQVGDVSVVSFPPGRINDDVVIAWILQDLRTLLYGEGRRAVLFDCTGVTYFVSGMTNNLLTIRRELAGLGGKLRFCHLSDAMTTAFDVQRLSKEPNPVFDVKGTEEEALTSPWEPLVIFNPPAK